MLLALAIVRQAHVGVAQSEAAALFASATTGSEPKAEHLRLPPQWQFAEEHRGKDPGGHRNRVITHHAGLSIVSDVGIGAPKDRQVPYPFRKGAILRSKG